MTSINQGLGVLSAPLELLLAAASGSRMSLVVYGDRIDVLRTSCSCWWWLGGACFRRDAPVTQRQTRNQCTCRKRQHAWGAFDETEHQDRSIHGCCGVDSTLLVESSYRHDKWQCANIIDIRINHGRPNPLSVRDG